MPSTTARPARPAVLPARRREQLRRRAERPQPDRIQPPRKGRGGALRPRRRTSSLYSWRPPTPGWMDPDDAPPSRLSERVPLPLGCPAAAAARTWGGASIGLPPAPYYLLRHVDLPTDPGSSGPLASFPSPPPPFLPPSCSEPKHGPHPSRTRITTHRRWRNSSRCESRSRRARRASRSSRASTRSSRRRSSRATSPAPRPE